jgi:hypothetical protein
LEALRDTEQLVLLGDLLELRHGPIRDALEAARPVLVEIGASLPEGAEVVIVPGNHDHHLLGPWAERRPSEEPLGLETPVDWRPCEPLGQLAEWLAPASVRAVYPGVWLREDVFATHGHYGDRHTTVPILERLGAGFMARVVSEPEGGPRRVEEYETTLAPMYAWLHALAQGGGQQLAGGSQTQAWRALTSSDGKRTLRRRGMVAAFPAAVAAISRAGLGPLRAELSGPELRRASLRGFGEVLARLDVQAPHVVFGHTHRAGPLPGDDRSEWRAAIGSLLMNTGSWVHEPVFLGSAPQRSPYRPGFAALLDGDRPPELVNLLDAVTAPVPV